jgi:uncharacterized protein (UPF0332 family)
VTNDLIRTARLLAAASPKKPRQAELRRAVSTAYYALFGAMARDAADLLIGRGRRHSPEAWRQVYRSLAHGPAKDACKQTRTLKFPMEICACADAFVDLQDARHAADYDPDRRFTRAETTRIILSSEKAIQALRAAPKLDREAFAVLLLLKKPRPG